MALTDVTILVLQLHGLSNPDVGALGVRHRPAPVDLEPVAPDFDYLHLGRSTRS